MLLDSKVPGLSNMGNGDDLIFRMYGGETLTLAISGFRIPGRRRENEWLCRDNVMFVWLAQFEELFLTNHMSRKVSVEIEEISKTVLAPRRPIRAYSTEA